MTYFGPFPTVPYQFGNAEEVVAFTDLTAYVEIVDRLKDNLAFYEEYFILEGDRADQISSKLYGTPNYYWVLYLMNDLIREKGWPLSERQLKKKAAQEFPNTTLTTTNSLTGVMKENTPIIGLGSSAVGTIIHRRLDFGQLIVRTSDTFQKGEVISSTSGVVGTETVQIRAQSEEYNAISHYEDATGRHRDVNPYDASIFGDPETGGYNGSFAPVTFIEQMRKENEDLKKIKVPKPDVVFEIANTFTDEMLNV